MLACFVKRGALRESNPKPNFNQLNKMRKILTHTASICAAVGALAIMTGCQTEHGSGEQSAATAAPAATQTAAPAAPAAAATPAAPATASTPAPVASQGGIIRIKAGSSAPFTDSSGNVWQAEKGFSGGDVVERDAGMAIANTKDAGLFLSEHYSMDSFSCSVPNGKYLAKLYFAETFEGISGPGDRVFSFDVQGHQFKDFDVWQKAGGANRAYVESVPVEVTNGKFLITFTPKVENPEINAIELIPQS